MGVSLSGGGDLDPQQGEDAAEAAVDQGFQADIAGAGAVWACAASGVHASAATAARG